MSRRRPILERLLRRLYYKYFSQNLLFELQDRARRESADYVQQHMAEAVLFENHDALLRFCVRRAPAEGSVLEFGVASGTSIRIIAEAATSRTVHGFDSFEGLPEDWTGHMEQRGAFSQQGRLPRVPANVRLHKGWFDATLPPFLGGDTQPVAFVHVDCDLYSSTHTVLRLLEKRFAVGTIVLFDEYLNYPGWRRHEFRAWNEFVSQSGIAYRYLALGARGGSVAVVVTGVP